MDVFSYRNIFKFQYMFRKDNKNSWIQNLIPLILETKILIWHKKILSLKTFF